MGDTQNETMNHSCHTFRSNRNIVYVTYEQKAHISKTDETNTNHWLESNWQIEIIRQRQCGNINLTPLLLQMKAVMEFQK